MEEIKSKWKLPNDYLKFLQCHSSNTVINNEEYGEIDIYGSDNLIQMQQGYSYNPITQEIISDWNHNYIVIADSMADPFCIDLSLENSPVYFAEHGCGEWEFSIAFNSFRDFLEQCEEI